MSEKPKATFRRERGRLFIEELGCEVSFNGRWVARNDAGEYLGHHMFRNDLKAQLEGAYDVEIIGD